MKLSIVIVNYNVKHFLEQCLYSVQKAVEGIDHEVFVVDNNSVDGSVNMLRERFPRVHLIVNKENRGFSRANNQAIRQAQGEYVLLLNPDTVVEEATFEKCTRFMDQHPGAGGLGVKMINGKGGFLPESKRSLPTPAVAFYKMSGLASLFPRSRIFGRYHLGYLDKEKTHQVEALSGAFMMLRRAALDKAGLLDEDFFMYGEDIDLSYRITLAGYKNYYFPEATIIHYKGESAKKGSINYVIVFYKAMIIFARKHFSGKRRWLLSLLIYLAVWARAGSAMGVRLVRNLTLPLGDATLVFTGFLLITPYWERYRFGTEGYYPELFVYYVVPSYIFIWLLSQFFSGAYERPLSLWRNSRGVLAGTALILIGYSLLSEDWRFSRALILLGSAWALLTTNLLRLVLHLSGLKHFRLSSRKRKRQLIVGHQNEAERVEKLIRETNIKSQVIGYVCPGTDCGTDNYLGSTAQLREMTEVHRADEIIFCARDIPANEIIRHMLQLANPRVEYKIASPDSISVIGSNSIDTAGDLYVLQLNAISKSHNRRYKRMFDLLFSLFLLILCPMLMFFMKKPLRFLGNIFMVIIASYTWVGYAGGAKTDKTALPPLKKGIVSAAGKRRKNASAELLEKINITYAKDYRLWYDLLIVLRNFRCLGNKAGQGGK